MTLTTILGALVLHRPIGLKSDDHVLLDGLPQLVLRFRLGGRGELYHLVVQLVDRRLLVARLMIGVPVRLKYV